MNTIATFKNRTKDQIRTDLIALMKDKTGLTNLKPTGVLRGIVEANIDLIHQVASHLTALDTQIDIRTATGQYLDMHAARFDIARLTPRHARGTVTLTVSRTAQVQKNDIFKDATTDLRYIVTADTSYKPSTPQTIPVIAETEGTRYNVQPNTPLQPIKATPGFISATLTIHTNGTDTQTDEALRAVVLDAYTSIIQGSVSAKYTTLLKKAEPAITSTTVDRTPDGFNSVDIYIKTSGAPLSPNRKKELLTTLDAVRPASTTLRIKDAQPVPVNIAITVSRGSGTATNSAILTALQTFFNSLKIHQSIEERDLYKALETLTADTLFITAPNALITIQKYQVASLGTLTINGATL